MRCSPALPTLLIFVGLLVAGCDRHDAGDHGHDHANASHDHDHEHDHGLEPVRVTAFTPRMGLFMEHEPIVAGAAVRALAHLTLLATGEPLTAGRVTLEFTAAGKAITFTAEKPARPGLFIPEVRLDQPGRYRAVLTVQAADQNEHIDLGEAVVHKDAQAAAQASPASSIAEAIPFTLEQQWKIGLLHAPAQTRRMTQRVETLARIETPPDAEAAVSTHVTGHLEPPPDGALPRIGDTVKARQVVGVVEMELPATEAATLAANRASTRAAAVDLTLRELELQSRLLEARGNHAQATARLQLARNSFRRSEQLRSQGLGTAEEHDRLAAELASAEAAEASGRELVAAYTQAQQKAGQLRAADAPAEDLDRPLHMPLEAPIDGQIVEAHHVQGEHIDAHAQVYRIIDTRRVWAVAYVSEFDLLKIRAEAGGLLTLDARPEQAMNLRDLGAKLVNISAVIDPQTRTAAVRYELPNPDGVLRAGMTGRLALATESVSEAVAVPAEAIVYDQGRSVVFVMVHGEAFERREVELGMREGGFVQIRRGITPGERIVTRGAYAVKLAAAAPAGFGHGHTH